MINRSLAVFAIFAVGTFSSLALSAFATDGLSTPVVSNAPEGIDQALNDKVETLLRTDVGLAGSQFRVQGKGGVVTVGGSVPDEHSLRRALDLASSVRGVREVRNAMEIDAPK